MTTKTKKNPNYRYCKKCGKPVTWFNYENIWEAGKIVAHQHTNCNAPDILNYQES